jgi:hypothetical protein
LALLGRPDSPKGPSYDPRPLQEFNVSWLHPILDALAEQPQIGYAPGAAPAAEPTAIAALGLAAAGRNRSAQQAADALAGWQQATGAVGVHANDLIPGWPTSLAILAWQVCGKAGDRDSNATDFAAQIERGVAWLLANRGKPTPRSPEMGHNSELIGWAYAEQTHSWVEPTALAVLALKKAGRGDLPATREGVAVLFDRQLPGGGLNYGNTFVLGQLLRPHVQPTGIALLALAGEDEADRRLAKTIAWLTRSISRETTPQSLAWAVLGLRAHGVELPAAEEWLAAAAEKVGGTLRGPPVGGAAQDTQSASDGCPFKLALLALAAKGWPA